MKFLLKTRRVIIGMVAAMGLIACGGVAIQAQAADWPYWRGPQQNRISLETGLVDHWNSKGGEGSNLLWKSKTLGSRSTPIVMDGRLYTICRSDPGTATEGEKVVCVDAKTGDVLWENRYNVYLSDVPAERVGWSCVTGDPTTGKIYAQGVCGLFQCIDGKTGKTLWKQSMHEKFGLLSTYGGRTNTPIIFEDLVITSAIFIGWGEYAKPQHRFIAFDKNTGQVIWYNGTRPLPYDTNYSSPTIAVIGGQAQLVVGSGDGGVWAFEPRTGKPIWKYRFSRRGLNVSPLVVGDTVYAGHSEENVKDVRMGALVAINAAGASGDITDTGERWLLRELMVGKSSPIVIGNRLYAIDDRAKMWIVDVNKGQLVGRKLSLGTVMRSSPLYADGKIYLTTANGRCYILSPNEKGAKKIHLLRLPPGEACHGSPIVANGRIYIPSTGAMYCLGSKDHKVAETAAPKPIQETPLANDTAVAHVQIIPAEVLISPGIEQQFQIRVFNGRGQLLDSQPATFRLDGAGEITPDGKFTASADAPHTATKVMATVGKVSGSARVRVVPSLPWKFDFENGQIPVTWVGARYRHVVRKVGGDWKMVKVSTIPKGTRSQAWFGSAELHDYTISAEMTGQLKNGKKPDMGLIAQGYICVLRGQFNDIQIRSWGTQLRMAKTVRFAWKADVTYVMKFRAANEGDRAVLRGKVWPKGQPEPKEWTVEATDDSPQRTGSPGLFGNATNAELALDNITVTANETK